METVVCCVLEHWRRVGNGEPERAAEAAMGPRRQDIASAAARARIDRT